MRQIPGIALQSGFSFRRALPVSAFLVGALATVGCGMHGGPLSTGTTGGGGTAVLVQGKVRGGQNPIAGATIAMYAAGKTGVGSAPRSMLTSAVTTDSGGNFNVTGLYSCNAGDEVYLVSSGGNSGSGINMAISLMSGLGSCSTLQANAATTTIVVNEASTVASVYALQWFMSGVQALGSDYTSTQSMDTLIGAFANVNTMVNTSTGVVPQSSTGNGVVPQTTINSLANSIAACVNSPSSGSQA